MRPHGRAARLFCCVPPPPRPTRLVDVCRRVTRLFLIIAWGAPRQSCGSRGQRHDTTLFCARPCRCAPARPRVRFSGACAMPPDRLRVFVCAGPPRVYSFLHRSWPVAVVPTVGRTTMPRFVLRDGVPLFARASDPRAILCRGVTMSACHPGPCLWVKAFARAVTDRVLPPRDPE
jgi:hypothetical protein